MKAQEHASTGHSFINKSRLQAKRLRAAHQKRLRQSGDPRPVIDPFKPTSDPTKSTADIIGDMGDINSFENVDWTLEEWDTDMYESGFYGAIDGMSGTFTNTACTGGMANVVSSVFGMIRHIAIYIPENSMKFMISSNNFTESTNTVVAFCNFSSFTGEVSALTNYRQWENYIRLGGRVGGVFIGETWTDNYDCIMQGVEAGIGHDVGFCTSTVGKAVLDAIL